MKIAWRYQLLPKMEAGPVSSSRFGHYYDLSKRIPQELIEASKWHRFFFQKKISSTFNVEPCSLTHGYKRLLQFIQNIIYEEGFDGCNPQKKQKNILRIGIQSLGSPLWETTFAVLRTVTTVTVLRSSCIFSVVFCEPLSQLVSSQCQHTLSRIKRLLLVLQTCQI